jgi:hypothetical protein
MLMEVGSDGVSVIDACAVLLGSARLATVSRIVCNVSTVTGAV